MASDLRARSRSAVRLGLVLLIAALAAAADSRPPDAARIMNYAEYARAERTYPYVLEYEADPGRLLLVGIAHTIDTNTETVARIWSEWGRFQPTVAFYEGTDSTPGASPEIVGKYGEAAAVRFLALANRVPATSVEPDMVDEIVHLQKTWSDEQIKLFYALRFVADRTGYGGAPATDAEVSDYLAGGFPPTIGGPLVTLDELETSYGRHFPAGTAWRSAPLHWFDPRLRTQFTNEVAAASGRFRDETMLTRLVERTRRGDRVFLAVGYSHVHMLEPALTDALGKPKR